MSKTSIFIGMILTVLFSLQSKVFGKAPAKPPVEKTYSDYLTPKSWEAIKKSQGVLVCIMPTFSTPNISITQAIVIDAKHGLLLSVAHGVSEFPDVAYGKNTMYSFIFNDAIYPAELKSVSTVADLAVFKIKDGDLSKLFSISFAKKINKFEEYYSFSQRINYDSEGLSIADNISWKAILVDINESTVTVPLNQFINMETIIENLIFDKSIISGFSGSGVFNKKGELIGMLVSSALPGGFSKAVSLNTIAPLIEAYKDIEKEEAKKVEPPKAGTPDAETKKK